MDLIGLKFGTFNFNEIPSNFQIEERDKITFKEYGNDTYDYELNKYDLIFIRKFWGQCNCIAFNKEGLTVKEVDDIGFTMDFKSRLNSDLRNFCRMMKKQDAIRVWKTKKKKARKKRKDNLKRTRKLLTNYIIKDLANIVMNYISSKDIVTFTTVKPKGYGDPRIMYISRYIKSVILKLFKN